MLGIGVSTYRPAERWSMLRQISCTDANSFSVVVENLPSKCDQVGPCRDYRMQTDPAVHRQEPAILLR
jgi:hypothetical protein